ncbi:MAG TPA: lipid II flippase MurJ, partial [Bacillota bacterium]|nr:lipid II flippase MurJ [Bacillota bacterium]
MKKSRTLATSTLILVAGSIASKLLGFLRESVLAYFYGATKVTDAYIIALSIPAFIMLGIGGAIGTSTISVASRIESEKGQGGVFRLVSTLANSAVLLSTALMLLGLGFIRPLIASLAPGFDEGTLALTTKLTIIMLPTAVLSLLQSVFNALLQYKGDFSIN